MADQHNLMYKAYPGIGATLEGLVELQRLTIELKLEIAHAKDPQFVFSSARCMEMMAKFAEQARDKIQGILDDVDYETEPESDPEQVIMPVFATLAVKFVCLSRILVSV